MPNYRNRRGRGNDFAGLVNSHDADVLSYLGVEEENIPPLAAGVEIELDYAKSLETLHTDFDDYTHAARETAHGVSRIVQTK
jgi:hypothetical protein